MRRYASRQLRRENRRAGKRARLLSLLLISGGALSLALLLTISYFYISYSRLVDERLAAGYLASRAGIYAAPRVLRAGQRMERANLVEALRRAGYVEGEASGVWSGRFRLEADQLVILPRRGAHADSASPSFEEVRLRFDAHGRIAELTGDGLRLDAYALEPEALTNDAAMKTGERLTLTYDDLPPVLVHAILAIEDRRFFEHRGLDPKGILRAFASWLSPAREGVAAGDDALRQGGSTITQQLVKNTYLTPERTLRRKFNEAILASVIERRLSKQDIFALYCNEIYLGQRGAKGVRGVGQAARLFFGKDLSALTLAEAATIAGMIQSPARYAPDRHAERAAARRNTVVEAMRSAGYITAAEAEEASAAPLTVADVDPGDTVAPYFIDYVNRRLEAQLDAVGERDERNLSVHTTLDLELQQLAEKSVARGLERLGKARRGDARPQAALVALDPQTGRILAMVGGASYRASQLNRATDARRQPGSVFKPFVYAAALEAGFSPTRLFADAPRAFQYDRRATYRPANYGDSYSMRQVTMRTALVRSLNVVTVDLAMQVGLARIAGLAESFGLPKAAPYPSMALGTTETTPLEIAAAYAALANGGRRITPFALTEVASGGDHLVRHQAETASTAQLVKPSTTYMLTEMLSAVIERGTARAARNAFTGTAVAGKTGTSRDGWFAGYTPNLVCVVWVGFDDNKELGLTGADASLPVWTEFVRGALELRPELGGASFPRPAGVTTVEIDPETGLLATTSCPQRERVALTHAALPASECYVHHQIFPFLAANESSHLTESGAPTPALQPDAAASFNSPASPVVHRRPSPPALAPPSATDTEEGKPLSPPPAPTTTEVEINPSGRSRLTNEMRVNSTVNGWKR